MSAPVEVNPKIVWVFQFVSLFLSRVGVVQSDHTVNQLLHRFEHLSCFGQAAREQVHSVGICFAIVGTEEIILVHVQGDFVGQLDIVHE